jgi:microsomal epoxide hydrolase
MQPRPFAVHIPDATLEDLRLRLTRTRWDQANPVPGWDRGADPGYLQELVAYWRTTFDWREQEATINRLHQYQADVDGLTIHFVHERGAGPNPLPIVLTHGFPDSFLRFLKILPLLTDPAAHGGDPADAFDVVIPSLPGHGFSDSPTKKGTTFRIGGLWDRLMTEGLGYRRFAAHGGDWGSTVTEQLARDHREHVLGIHLTDVPFAHLFRPPNDPSDTEQRFLKAAEHWQQKEGAYAMIQSSRPQSLAPALMDSPAGLAAWIVEKFCLWSDCHGKVESRFTKDELLTNITLYWVTGTIGSSFLTYYDSANAGALTWVVEMLRGWTGSSKVPTGFASFPRDLLPPPREWVERFYNLQRWSEMPRGGHFAAMEEPEMLVEELRAFFRPLREEQYTRH